MRLASPLTAALLGLLVFSQAVSLWALSAHGVSLFHDGVETWITFMFGAVGVLIARRDPRNAIGWILFVVGLSFTPCTTAAAGYLANDYGHHGGTLAFGNTAIVLGQLWPLPLLLGPLVILLFPDGRLPSPRWKWVLRAYLAASAFILAAFVTEALDAIFEGRVQINADGFLTSASPRIFSSTAAHIAGPFVIFFVPACWLAFLVRQVISFRRSSGERRQQLKWVISGAAITAASIPGFIGGGSSHSPIVTALVTASVLGLAALPVSIGVAILKFRLYEIDRLISRTLSYAVLTGLLVSVYFGVVTVATEALPLSSPVAVAASTLVAAALFNPLRRRVQHIVDRRFNRARYDSDATLAAFTTQLRDAIDLNSIGGGLVDAVNRAVEPAHASLWIRPPSARPGSAATPP